MTRLFAAFGLYWHIILDLILTHVYAIAFLNAGYASIAAFLIAVDALLKATLMIFLSRLIAPLSSAMRGRLSVLLRFILIAIWYSAVVQLPINSISFSIFLPFILFKIFLSADSSLSTEFIFSLREYFHINISQSAAAMNILMRSGTAIAPAVALMLLTTHYAIWGVILSVFVLGALSTILLRKIFFAQGNHHHFSHKKYTPFSVLIQNPLMYWGFSFQFLANLAFSGVGFLLLAQLRLHGNIFLNEITILYTAFFITQFIVLIWGDAIIFGNQLKHMVWMVIICAVLVLIAGVSSGFMRLGVCGLIGFVYSLMLSGGQKIITAPLKGEGFVEYSSWAQLIGRSTSFASTAALGVLMNCGLSSSILLLLCGGVGILSAILLASLVPKITTAYEERF